MFHRIFFIFKLDIYFYILEAGQSWPNYIGLKRGRPQACLMNPVYAPFSCRWRGLDYPLLISLCQVEDSDESDQIQVIVIE